MILKDGKMFRVEVTTGHYMHYVSTNTNKITHPTHDPAKYDVLAVVLFDRIAYLPDVLY